MEFSTGPYVDLIPFSTVDFTVDPVFEDTSIDTLTPLFKTDTKQMVFVLEFELYKE